MKKMKKLLMLMAVAVTSFTFTAWRLFPCLYWPCSYFFLYEFFGECVCPLPQ